MDVIQRCCDSLIQVWEAAESAVKYQLDNLVVFVDNNRLQNDGECEDIMPTQDLQEKFKAFGFETYRINGHAMEEIVGTLDTVRANKNGKPKAIVCNTVKGKGISFVEKAGVANHSMPISKEEMEAGLAELGGVQ